MIITEASNQLTRRKINRETRVPPIKIEREKKEYKGIIEKLKAWMKSSKCGQDQFESKPCPSSVLITRVHGFQCEESTRSSALSINSVCWHALLLFPSTLHVAVDRFYIALARSSAVPINSACCC